MSRVYNRKTKEGKNRLIRKLHKEGRRVKVLPTMEGYDILASRPNMDWHLSYYKKKALASGRRRK